MSRPLTAMLCAVLLGAGLVVANAQAPQATYAQSSMPRTDLKRGERKFLETAARHNMAGVKAGRIAEAQGASMEVRNFGRQMTQDRGRSYEEVVRLAKEKGISLPTQPERRQRKEAARLLGLKGAEFDHEYIGLVVKDHEKDVKSFQKMLRSARDPDVKAFASRTLPVLEGHLRMAREIHAATSNAK